MMQEQETQLSAAVIATTKVILDLVSLRSGQAQPRRLTARHLDMLRGAAGCFEQASKILAEMVAESERA